MTLSWDPDDERVVIEVFPYTEAAVVSPDQLDEELEEPEPDEVFLVRHRRRERPGLRQARRAGARGRPAQLPVLRQPDRPRRPPVRARERLPPPGPVSQAPSDELEGRARPPRPDHAGVERHLRRRDRRGPGRLQADLGGAAAVGLPRRHARRPRGGGVPRLRGARLGRRAADLAARRSARTGHGAALAGARPGAGGGDPGRRGQRAGGLAARLRRHRRPRPAGLAGPRGQRAAAPDGGLRRRRQQRRPQGRSRPGDDRRAPVRRRPRRHLPRRAQAADGAVGLAGGAAARGRPRGGAPAGQGPGRPARRRAVGAPHRPGDRRRWSGGATGWSSGRSCRRPAGQ